MAKATVVPPVTETKVIEVEPAKVTLELTLDEASILRTVLGQFVGMSPTSPLYKALADSGVTERVGRVHMLDGSGEFTLKRSLKFVSKGTEPW